MAGVGVRNAADLAGADGVTAGAPGFCAGAYFDAHLACSSVAWKTPSRPKVPMASACALSLKVSGGGSRSGVLHRQPLVQLDQNELRVCAVALNGAG